MPAPVLEKRISSVFMEELLNQGAQRFYEDPLEDLFGAQAVAFRADSPKGNR